MHSKATPSFPGHPTEIEVSIVDIVRFAARNWWLILLPGVGLGLLTLLVAFVFLPRTYESSAVLVILEPRFSSELKPPTLSVQAYQNLLESDAVVSDTIQRLIAQGKIDPGDVPRLGEELETRIFVSRRAEETSLAPMLQVTARAPSADLATDIANTWANVFLERVRKLMGGTTTTTIQLIDDLYPDARARLVEQERLRARVASDFQRQLDAAAAESDSRIARLKVETSEQVGRFNVETKRLEEEFLSQSNLTTRQDQLAALRKTYSTLQEEQARISAELFQKQLQLDEGRRQLQKTPPVLDLQKSMSDDALWTAVTKAEDPKQNLDRIQQLRLTSQVVNPVYSELAAKVAAFEMEVNSLVPRSVQLKEQLGRMEEEQLKSLDASVRADTVKLEGLRQQRAAGLVKLQEERANQLNAANRDRQLATDSLTRERDNQLAQLDRDINQQKELYAELARKYNQVFLAKDQQTFEDIRLGAPAVRPARPQTRQLFIYALLAALLGLAVGVATAVTREALRWSPAESR